MSITGIADLDNIIYAYVNGNEKYITLIKDFHMNVSVVELKHNTIIIYNEENDDTFRATDYYWNGYDLSFGKFDNNLNIISNTYVHDYWLETIEPFIASRHILINTEIREYMLEYDEDVEDMFMCNGCFNHIFDGMCKDCRI